jgi:SNF2 family DNA or RNA helicase
MGLLEDAPTLVVCPTSLASNWKREFNRFAPSLTVKIAAGPYRDAMVRRAVGAKRKRGSGQIDVLIISYASVRIDVEELSKHAFSGFVIDEVSS